MKDTLLKGDESDGPCDCTETYGYDRYQPCGYDCGRMIDLGKEDAVHYRGEHWHVLCRSSKSSSK